MLQARDVAMGVAPGANVVTNCSLQEQVFFLSFHGPRGAYSSLGACSSPGAYLPCLQAPTEARDYAIDMCTQRSTGEACPMLTTS
jgi:hypothetical protein